MLSHVELVMSNDNAVAYQYYCFVLVRSEHFSVLSFLLVASERSQGQNFEVLFSLSYLAT